jgi:hypothetical protein
MGKLLRSTIAVSVFYALMEVVKTRSLGISSALYGVGGNAISDGIQLVTKLNRSEAE